MIERATSPASIQSMLKTLQAYQTEATQGLQPAAAGDATRGVSRTGFADLVGNAVGQVNELQQQSRALQSAYERGEAVPLTDVVLGMQKSSIAFEATLQVRNKVLKAYEDILNMPV
jgi:flagellar hook-basal body complex protein FliE